MNLDNRNSGLRPIDRRGAPGALPFDSSSGIRANVLTLALRHLSYNFSGRGDGNLDARFTGFALAATFLF